MFRLGGAAAAINLAALSARAEAPAKPTTPMPPVEAFATPPFVDEITLSPDASRCAIVSQSGDDKLLLHFKLAEHDAPMKRINMAPAKIRGLFFGDNSHVVLINSVTAALPQFAGNKHEFSMARSVTLDTAEMITFFSREDNFYGIVLGNIERVKVDGEYRVTASNYRMAIPYSLCLFSFGLTAARGKLLHEGTNDTEGWVLTPDGRPLAYADYSGDRKTWELYFNLAEPGKANRFKQIYSIKEPLNTPDLVGLGRDGKSVLLFINSGEDEGRYHEVSGDGVLSPPLETGGEDKATRALFHPTTKRLVGFSHHDDWFTYDYFDPLLKKLAEGLAPSMGDDYRISMIDFAEDPRKMILYGESAFDAGTYFYIDFSTGEIQILAQNYPDLEQEWITQKTPISYTAADGLKIEGYLTLPPFKAAKNLPLIVLPHGGPQSRDTIGFDWQVQCLASRGYAVLQPNFRGSSGYGDDFITKGHGEWGRKMQTDLSDGVRWLAKQGTVDPKRVAIMGASYGGYAALAGATLDAGVYRCAVSIAGVSDLKSMLSFEIDQHSRDSRSVRYWKQFTGNPKTYEDVSPARQAARAYCPILLIHGTDDTVVAIDQSKRMEKALKEAGKPVEFVTYKGQDHWETVGSHRIGMMKSALAFLEKHNPAG
ncbi:hypothetical protein ABAC460_21805 [Asticcacaulis sp. AC460]|nr:hypothetical protein ABAC460_21805 [Asticcacaulis sp. AC460]